MDRGVEKAGAALDRGGRSECCVSGRARMRTVQLVVEGFRGRVQVARGCPNPRRFQLPFVPACSNLRATNEKHPVACFDKVEWNSECLFRCFGRSLECKVWHQMKPEKSWRSIPRLTCIIGCLACRRNTSDQMSKS